MKEGEIGYLSIIAGSWCIHSPGSIPHLCIAIHLDRPVTSVNRLSEIRMSTVVGLETLKFKAVMNKQRMNATELLLYL